MDILKYLKSNEHNIRHDLKKVVLSESPTNDKVLVDKCGEILSQMFINYLKDVEVNVFKQEEVGNHLKITYGSGEQQILILGHFDTVWNKGSINYVDTGKKIYGPGVLDMKMGIIQGIWAVKALKEKGIDFEKRIVFLLNSDEEEQSASSKQFIKDEAEKSECVLVLEPSESKTGKLKTSRKGTGEFRIRVKGCASHAGNHHEEGANAILELSKQIIKLQNLTNYKIGTTINVGIINGGTKRNVVPEHAECVVDVRVTSESEAAKINEYIYSLKPSNPDTIIEVRGKFNRPPMKRNEANKKLFLKVKEIGELLDIKLEETSAGGGSDGNFTSSIGIPTLDGLGAVGSGPHARNEHIIFEDCINRAAIFAHLIQELQNQDSI